MTAEISFDSKHFENLELIRGKGSETRKFYSFWENCKRLTAVLNERQIILNGSWLSVQIFEKLKTNKMEQHCQIWINPKKLENHISVLILTMVQVNMIQLQIRFIDILSIQTSCFIRINGHTFLESNDWNRLDWNIIVPMNFLYSSQFNFVRQRHFCFWINFKCFFVTCFMIFPLLFS